MDTCYSGYAGTRASKKLVKLLSVNTGLSKSRYSKEIFKPFWLKNFQRHLAANLQHFWTKRRNRPNCGRPPVVELFGESDWQIITSLTSIPARIRGRASLAAPWWSKLQLVLWQNTPSYYQPNLNCRLVPWCQHQNRSFLQYHVIYYPWWRKRQAVDYWRSNSRITAFHKISQVWCEHRLDRFAPLFLP